MTTPDPPVTWGDSNNRSPTSVLASQDAHQQPTFKPLQKKHIETVMSFLNIHPLKKAYFQCTQSQCIEYGSLADESHASLTVFMKVFECSSSLVPSSTATDFTNWFPFILRGELITKISCCSAGMDGGAAASSLEPNH